MSIPLADDNTNQEDSTKENLDLKRVHPTSVVLEWLGVLRRGALPIGLVLYRSGEDGITRVLVALTIILLLAAFWSILVWYMTRYRITKDSLVIREGVLRRKLRTIPFGRIQTINLEQSLMQRILGLAELRVETASQGSEAEATLNALKYKNAIELRDHLLAERKYLIVGDVDVSVKPEQNSHQVQSDIVAKLSIEDLMVAGGTSSNLGVLLAVLISGCERFGSSLFDRLSLPNLDSPIRVLQNVLSGNLLMGALLLSLVASVVIVAWMFSVAAAVVKWYDFSLEKSGQELRRKHGLFSRVEASIPLARAQALKFRQSILRRPFGRGDLLVFSAGSVVSPNDRSGGIQHLVPILRDAEVPRTVNAVFPDADFSSQDFFGKLNSAIWKRASVFSWIRASIVSSAWFLLLVALVFAWKGSTWLVALWGLPLLWIHSGLKWQVRAITSIPGYLLVRSGGFARSIMIIPERKLQLMEISQGPLQRFFDLGSLHLTTAGSGGDATIVDMSVSFLRAFQNGLAERMPRTTCKKQLLKRSTFSNGASGNE